MADKMIEKNEQSAVCPCQAGICPKPERTYGEPHYCELDDLHASDHKCRRCGMEFNADGVYTNDYIKRRRKTVEPVASPLVLGEPCPKREETKNTAEQSKIGETLMSDCRLCAEGNVPEFSEYAKVYIHRHPKRDRRCERLSPSGQSDSKWDLETLIDKMATRAFYPSIDHLLSFLRELRQLRKDRHIGSEETMNGQMNPADRKRTHAEETLLAAIAKFRQNAGRHDGEHIYTQRVCAECDLAYIKAESELYETYEKVTGERP